MMNEVVQGALEEKQAIYISLDFDNDDDDDDDVSEN